MGMRRRQKPESNAGAEGAMAPQQPGTPTPALRLLCSAPTGSTFAARGYIGNVDVLRPGIIPVNPMTANHALTYRGLKIVSIALAFLCFFLLASCSTDEPEAAEATASPVPERPSPADTAEVLLEGVVRQTVYVPVYSHIYHQDGTREFNLTATLSIRNTDPDHAITISAVRYNDSAGRLVRQYLEAPLQLTPLASRPFVVEEQDKAGGVGANFIVEWQAGTTVSAPLIEAVMISTASTQGLSFVTRGQVVRPLGNDSDPGQQP